jgi:hypothetical protein
MSKLPEECFASCGMEEVAMRRSLFAAWKNSISEFQFQLGIVADFFADIGHPDEAVCRARWIAEGLANKDGNPGGWWQWAVFPKDAGKSWNAVNCRLRGRKLNFSEWLCWPEHWVRLPSYYIGNRDWMMHYKFESMALLEKARICDGWRITLGPKQHQYCTPIERIHGRFGWTALFHPQGALREEFKNLLF